MYQNVKENWDQRNNFCLHAIYSNFHFLFKSWNVGQDKNYIKLQYIKNLKSVQVKE